MKNQKYLIKCLLLLISAGIVCSCEPEAIVSNITVTVQESEVSTNEDGFVTEGFLVTATANTSAGNTVFADFLENKPSGNLDLTQGESLPGFRVSTVYKNFMYSRDKDNGQIFSKYAINSETQNVTKVGEIQLSANLSNVKIIDDVIGVYTIFDVQSLFVFNPSTMDFIQEIPFTNPITFEITGNDAVQNNFYSHIIHRPQDNRVFLALTTNIGVTPQFYDAQDVVVEVVNLNTMLWESSTRYEQAMFPITRGNENSVIDENGNIFITCQGSYSLDGLAGPLAPTRSRPQILKIPAGSTSFDLNYSFNPVNQIGLTNIVAQFITGTIYDSNGIAYACISATSDLPRVNELVFLFATGVITDNEFDELSNLVLNEPTSRWVKLNLNTKTVEIIDDMPITAGFQFNNSYKFEGAFYFQVVNADLNLNGYYEYNPETNTSFNIFNINSGGAIGNLVILKK